MSIGQKSSSIEQMRAEEKIFTLVEKSLNVSLEKNPKLYLSNNEYTYIQPDFYSAEHCIVGEIFALFAGNGGKLAFRRRDGKKNTLVDAQFLVMFQ